MMVKKGGTGVLGEQKVPFIIWTLLEGQFPVCELGLPEHVCSSLRS